MEVIWMAPKKFSPEFREQVAHAVIGLIANQGVAGTRV
jgi:hypothetical protein